MAISNSSFVQNKYAAYNELQQSEKSYVQTQKNKEDSSNKIDDIQDTYTPSCSKADVVSSASKKVYGNTIGQPKLSDEAAAYYEELKKKYSKLNFVLVSSAEKDGALAKAAKYNNGYQITAVIDDEKLEKMATDPEYRKQMEAYIDNAITQMESLQNKLDEAGLSELISGLGMQVNDDGTVDFFAALKEMSKAQMERIEEAREESREEAKEARNKERLKAYEEQMKPQKETNNVLKASSIDELIEKISNYKTEE